MPNPHKVKIKNHKVTKNAHPVTHFRDTVTFEPEQPEIIEIVFDQRSPFVDDHLVATNPGDSISRKVNKLVSVRTHFPYRTLPETIQPDTTGPEIIVDPGGDKGGGKGRKGAGKKSSRKGKSTAKKARKRSVRKGKKKAGKKR